MAYRPEEIEWFKQTLEEMTKRMADKDNTSGEAVSDYSRIGHICVKALAKEAAASARRATRTTHAPKFKEAREARNKPKNTTTQTPPTGRTQGTQGQSNRA